MITVRNDSELRDVAARASKVVVYGASDRARSLLYRWIVGDLGERPTVAVTSPISASVWLDVIDLEQGSLALGMDPTYRFPVESIETVLSRWPEATVLVCANSQNGRAMRDHAVALGASAVFAIDSAFLAQLMDERNSFVASEAAKRTLRESRIQTALLQRERQEKLADRVRTVAERGEKIRVVFLVTSPAKFTAESVCRAMVDHPVFDPVVFLLDEETWSGRDAAAAVATSKSMAQTRAYAESLRASGLQVEWGYDASGAPRDIAECSAHVLFHSSPYMIDRHPHHNVRRAVENHLSCYVPYGAEVANEVSYHFDTPTIAHAWRHFVSCPQAWEVGMNSSMSGAMNAVYLGLPSLDALERPLSPLGGGLLRTEWAGSGRPTVVYAPHWAMAGWHGMGSFHQVAPALLGYAKENPDIQWVLRPHPRIGPELAAMDGNSGAPMSYSDYCALLEEWDGLSNGAVVADGNPADLFRDTDVLLTDSYSFVATWLPTGRPCVYLADVASIDRLTASFYPFVGDILDAYYLESGVDDALSRIRGLLVGQDPLLQRRTEVAASFAPTNGRAGAAIVEYLKKHLLPNSPIVMEGC